MPQKILFLTAILFAGHLFAADTNAITAAKPTADPEAAYRETIEKRVADIVVPLELKDAGKAKNVHDILVAQYRTLRDWHDANDTKRKTAKADEAGQLKKSLKEIHEKFLAKLSANLTPQQVEQVKDKMTYGKVQFTYTGYMNEYPTLTDEQKAHVLELLKEAREEAMDGGSSEEKSAIFNRYKGKINNYLSAQGVSAPKKKPTVSRTNSGAEKQQPAGVTH
jgi:Spy/CpxP family protein refolding chaperone